MTEMRHANCDALMTVKVTPKAPNCGAWNRILLGPALLNSVTSSSEGLSLVAVLRGNLDFGNGAVGGGGKEVVTGMLGNW